MGLDLRRLASLSIMTTVLFAAIAILLYNLVAPDGPANARFSADHLSRTEIFPLLQESHRQVLAGEPEVAARILLRAEDLAPERTSIALLRERIEIDAREEAAARMRHEELTDLLGESRRALDQGRTQRAERLATQALSLHPENPEAQTLIEAAQVRKRAAASRRTEPKATPPAAVSAEVKAPAAQTQPSATDARPVPIPTPPPSREAQPLTRTDPVTTGTANLKVDVFSYLSKGVLTVYADRDQVLLQPFRFVQRSGFMRRKKTAGRLETSIEVPSGDTEFRIYVSADGQETQSVNLSADLTGGETHVLRLIIAENGSASAQLN